MWSVLRNRAGSSPKVGSGENWNKPEPIVCAEPGPEPIASLEAEEVTAERPRKYVPAGRAMDSPLTSWRNPSAPGLKVLASPLEVLVATTLPELSVLPPRVARILKLVDT